MAVSQLRKAEKPDLPNEIVSQNLRLIPSTSIPITYGPFGDFRGGTFVASATAQAAAAADVVLTTCPIPFLAHNPMEFWNGWVQYIAHPVTIITIGLWHGAGLNYLVFGFYWGIAITLAYGLRRIVSVARKEKEFGSLHAVLNGRGHETTSDWNNRMREFPIIGTCGGRSVRVARV